MLTSFHYLGLLQADPRNAENGVGVGWSLHKMLFLPLKGLLVKVLHERFIFVIKNSVSITLKIVWLLREKAKTILLKGKDNFCCASIFSPALPTGSTLQCLIPYGPLWGRSDAFVSVRLNARALFLFSHTRNKHQQSANLKEPVLHWQKQPLNNS